MPYKDPAKQKENSQKYYQENRDKLVAQKREDYQANKEEINSQRREDYQNDPEYRDRVKKKNKASRVRNKDKIAVGRRTVAKRFSIVKSSAKSRGLSCTLNKEQYQDLIGKSCFYCDNYLATVQDSTGIGLDRLDNSRGYEIDNVIPCCVVCNRVRNEHFTPEETKVAIQAVVSFRKGQQ